MGSGVGVVSPLPATRVIPPGWSDWHVPVAAGGMTGVCQVIREGAGVVWDPVLEEMTPAPGVVVYDGPVRVQRLDGDTLPSETAGDVTGESRYLVAVRKVCPWVPRNTQIVFTAVPNDSSLVGMVMYVGRVLSGTERWQRDLICSEQPWRPHV